MGAGAAFFGFGGVAFVAAAIYGAPMLLPVAEVLMGLGGALFLRGMSAHIRHAFVILLTVGLATLLGAVLLLLTRTAVGAGFGMAWFSLAWTLALVGAGLYGAAAAPASATRPARGTFK